MFNYNKIYKNHKFTWSNNVNAIIRKALRLFKVEIKGKLKVLDLGCGQGRDAFFLARKGFKITAIDSSAVAIKQICERANKYKNLSIKAICGNVKNYKIKNNEYDIIVSIDCLQFLKRKEAINLIKNIKNNLKNGGLVVLSSFTIKDPSYSQPSKRSIQYYFKPGEMKGYFENFKLLFYSERIVTDPGHANKNYPHKHGLVEIIARKI